jgi:hypothetical protein
MTKCVAIVALLVAGLVDADGLVYNGCYHDGWDQGQGVRDLNITFCRGSESGVGPSPSDATFTGSCGTDQAHGNEDSFAGRTVMTPTLCSALCTGYKFFGLQNGNSCFCGDDYGNQGGKVAESDCGAQCTGDSSIMCGGSNRNSIYAQPSTALNATKAK